MSEPIEFWFDFASGYAYLSAERFAALAARCGRRVLWRPYLLGAVFKISGGRPATEAPIKAAYYHRDIARSARLLGLPLRFPATAPINPVRAARTAYWCEAHAPEHMAAVCHALLQAHWGQGRDITTAEVCAEIAAEICGQPAAYIAADSQSPGIKDRLRAVTDEGMAKGAFGSPFMFVDGEPFWGGDRLEQVERWLQTGGW
jgi:2-hydroxychromene-2-carboxylate isomerase